MKNKIALIVPYFGKLPNYFQIFLDSCSYNKEFDWLIFSNDTTEFIYPHNVHFIKTTFEECQKIVQSKFDFPIVLHKPQKLCDYKCAYGYIFSDYIKNYNWWGYCDLDQIFGNLGHFITDDMLDKYDKIGSIGHLTLYRNTDDNNTVFMNTERYKQVFTVERGCGFDEWLPGNINEIYLKEGNAVYWKNLGADINSYRTTFQLVDYNMNRGVYECFDITNSIFSFEKGKLNYICVCDGELVYTEYPYVHLQKRTMIDCRRNQQTDRFYIVPNKFVDMNINPLVLLHKSSIFRWFNFQFVKVKINSLKYRINNADWDFTSVF